MVWGLQKGTHCVQFLARTASKNCGVYTMVFADLVSRGLPVPILTTLEKERGVDEGHCREVIRSLLRPDPDATPEVMALSNTQANTHNK